MDDTVAALEAGLGALGIPHTEGHAHALAHHLALVAEANASFNLTTIPADQSVAMHVLDSASALSFLDQAPPGAFVDIGSGAGFPGIPLGVLSGRHVTLVESVKKKAAFLERVIAELRLEATVRGVRAEELAGEAPGAFAAVTARALSALPSLVELASPLLVEGGLLICLKGSPDEAELSRGSAAGVRCGMEFVGATPVGVPGVPAARTVVVYRRRGRSTLRLPRRNGMAQRQPLA